MVNTFSNRKKNVRKKLNAMALEFANKIVLLVDGKSFITSNQDIANSCSTRFNCPRNDIERDRADG